MPSIGVSLKTKTPTPTLTPHPYSCLYQAYLFYFFTVAKV